MFKEYRDINNTGQALVKTNSSSDKQDASACLSASTPSLSNQNDDLKSVNKRRSSKKSSPLKLESNEHDQQQTLMLQNFDINMSNAPCLSLPVIDHSEAELIQQQINTIEQDRPEIINDVSFLTNSASTTSFNNLSKYNLQSFETHNNSSSIYAQEPINFQQDFSISDLNSNMFINTEQAQNFIIQQPQKQELNPNQIIQKLNLNNLSIQMVKHHPRPSAVTSFNARLTDNGGGFTLWDRRQDNLRLELSKTFLQNGFGSFF